MTIKVCLANKAHFVQGRRWPSSSVNRTPVHVQMTRSPVVESYIQVGGRSWDNWLLDMETGPRYFVLSAESLGQASQARAAGPEALKRRRRIGWKSSIRVGRDLGGGVCIAGWEIDTMHARLWETAGMFCLLAIGARHPIGKVAEYPHAEDSSINFSARGTGFCQYFDMLCLDQKHDGGMPLLSCPLAWLWWQRRQ